MNREVDDIRTAVSTLTNAMSELVRAIDVVANDEAAATEIPNVLPEQLERLAARLSAVRAFSG
jgi:hypothetical protein